MNATLLSRKINKILETPIDDTELLQSLLYLSNFYSVNDINGRRNLRGEIEKRNFETNQKFLQNFEFVQQELQKIENTIESMKSSYKNMEEIFYKTQKSAGAIIEDTHALQLALQKVEGKSKVILKFLDAFQLTEEEKANLMIDFSKEEEHKPSEQFFHSLRRVQEINSNCKLLLRTHHQKAGIEIMEVMSILLQTAYDQLYRWILSEFQQMNDQISPEFPIELNWALRSLMHERPVLFQYCLDTIIDFRSTTVFQAFIRALQHGGPNGIPKPIEIHSHDPFRYVGDMLGCLHQLLASEFELLFSLFDQRKPQPQSFSSSSSSSSVQSPARPSKIKDKNEIDHEIKTQITRILSKSFESVCRPFQVRVDQVITSQSEIVTLFRLANLCDFYIRTIMKIINADSMLISTIQNAKKQALQFLFDLIQKQSDYLQKTPPLPPIDLSPPQLVHQTVNQLMEIMSYFDSSLVPVDERESEFKPILNSIVDPLVKMCNLSASVLENASDMAVYLINNFSLIQSSLISYSFAIFKAESINAQIDAHMETLVQEESIGTLRKCKLASKLEIFQDWSNKPLPREPLSRVLDMDARQLSDSMRSFEASLFDIGAMVLPQCEKLYSSRLKSKARGQVSERIVNSFTALYEAIVDPSNQYENPALIVPYKPDQVRTMLCQS